MSPKEKFFQKFNFVPKRSGMVGVEREQFTTDISGIIVPQSKVYLDRLAQCGGIDHSICAFGFELSACQLESKIGPCCIGDLDFNLRNVDRILEYVDGDVGLRRINTPFAPEDMPLDVYPDPTGRYQQITLNMPKHILKAACRVAATHIHVGMASFDQALNAYNKAIKNIDELMQIGDTCSGQRMNEYRVMAGRFMPETIDSFDDFYEQSQRFGFVDDPRTCWTLIRISVHGTIEFRMFDATGSVDAICDWARLCHGICH